MPPTRLHRLQEILPWFAHNAMIHYLAPRGLEQYSGGGWGTRDVCQGPVETAARARHDGSRCAICCCGCSRRRTPTATGRNGSCSSSASAAFDRPIRTATSSSGRCWRWPSTSLHRTTSSLLDEVVPFFHPQGDDQAEQATIWGHVERALAVIAAARHPGHAVWPPMATATGTTRCSRSDPAMCERLCSAWTVTLHYQTLTTLAAALRRIGRAAAAAAVRGVGAAHPR